MRETRLLDYGESAAIAHYKHADIVISLGGLQPREAVYGKWAGLVDGSTSWRVEGGEAIILENALSHTGLILKFSSPLTCTPLFRTATNDNGKFIEVLASCFSGRNGCVLVRLRASVPNEKSEGAAPHVQEVSRCTYSSSWVTSVAEVSGDVILGCADGRCALLLFHSEGSDGMEVVAFAAQPPTGDNSQNHGENTSMVSAASVDSGPSRRSVGSSMSLGLMNRLFGSPRGSESGQQAVEASSVENSYYRRLTRRSVDRRPSAAQPIDKVLSVTSVLLDVKAVASLHESGRLCVYAFKGRSYQFVGDIALPVKLASSSIDHFLLTGLRESILAVVTVDEDPQADSLQVFNVTVKPHNSGSVSLSSMQIVKREGPIDRIVSAVFTGEDVIVASETGLVSGLLNVPDEESTTSGLPSGTLWTAIDDVDQPFGFGRILEGVFPDVRFQLLSAHRFTTSTVAKALRLDNPEAVTRKALTAAVRGMNFEDDEEAGWKRVLTRAKQICKSDQLQIRSISVVDGVGVVVARRASVFVLRELVEDDKMSLPRGLRLLTKKDVIRNSEASALVSSHGLSQVLAAQYKIESESGSLRPELKFMLRASVSFSGEPISVPLTDRLSIQCLQTRALQEDISMDFASTLHWMMNAMKPGAELLSFLHMCTEMELLKEAVEFAADTLPISSMFATGLSWLSQYRELIHGRDTEDEAGTSSEGLKGNQPSALLNQAYGCLVTAAEWCKNESAISDNDAECSMSLAGLLDSSSDASGSVHGVGYQQTQGDVEMSGSNHRLSSHPDSRLVRQHLGFWLLERAVRLLESSGAPKSAAAAALEAMSLAPDRRRHEMMRAAAFSRFLDAGELEHALTAILNSPYQGEASAQAQAEESAALRDAIGLFVNAAAESGSLKWLSGCQLPEPLHALCGLALERRARAADVMQQYHLSSRQNMEGNSIAPDPIGSTEQERSQSEYEQLYSWHIMRGDEGSAAAAALEWGERLTKEGLGAIRNIISNKSRYVSANQHLKLLLEWARMKCDAWSYASASAEMQVQEWKYIVRSRYSLLTDESPNGERGTVDLSWVSRRHLLALGQCRCLTEMLSEDDLEGTLEQRIEYLLSQNSVLLGEQREGVRWVVNVLMKYPSQDNMLLCAELATAWVPEIGDGALREVVQVAASVAAQKSISSFDYPELEELLQSVTSTARTVGFSRNWNLLALESSLATSAGAVASPQWLIDAAAWGTDGLSEERASEPAFCGKKRGDAAGVARTLLRNNRPVDAAKVLLAGLSAEQKRSSGDQNKTRYVPYSAIDSTVEVLAQLAEDYPDAERYQKLLTESTKAHIAEMEKSISTGIQIAL